jgi:hypothetical protein
MDWEKKLSPQNSIRKGQYGKGFLEHDIAALPGVQAYLDEALFEAQVRAEEDLKEHQAHWREGDEMDDVMLDVFGGHSYIDTAKGDIDRFLILNDERGQMAAAAIEYGHAAYTVTREKKDGTTVTYEVGASEGTFILHRAVNLRAKGGKQRMKRVKAKTKNGRTTIK